MAGWDEDRRYLATAPDYPTARQAQIRYAGMLVTKQANRLWAVSIEPFHWRECGISQTTYILYLIRKKGGKNASIARMGEKFGKQSKRKLRRNRSIAGRDDRNT